MRHSLLDTPLTRARAGGCGRYGRKLRCAAQAHVLLRTDFNGGAGKNLRDRAIDHRPYKGVSAPGLYVGAAISRPPPGFAVQPYNTKGESAGCGNV